MEKCYASVFFRVLRVSSQPPWERGPVRSSVGGFIQAPIGGASVFSTSHGDLIKVTGHTYNHQFYDLCNSSIPRLVRIENEAGVRFRMTTFTGDRRSGPLAKFYKYTCDASQWSRDEILAHTGSRR